MNSFDPKRRPDETFDDYKARRKRENKDLSDHLSGVNYFSENFDSSDIKVPMFTCCFTAYGKSESNVEASSFTIVRIGDRSNEVVYRDWIFKEDPITGKVNDMKDIDKFLDKNIEFLAKNYKGTSVYNTDGVVPLEKCTRCDCGQYLDRVITYEDYIRGAKGGIFK